jgi:hypothetical protein
MIPFAPSRGSAGWSDGLVSHGSRHGLNSPPFRGWFNHKEGGFAGRAEVSLSRFFTWVYFLDFQQGESLD